jgi:hypothetical protein
MLFWRSKKPREGFPAEFTIQKIGSVAAKAVSHLTAPEMAAYFRQNPSLGKELLTESHDKRVSPSTFLTEEVDGYTVGWFSRHTGYQYEKRFSNLADAAADYVLFSLGKGRWTPPGA